MEKRCSECAEHGDGFSNWCNKKEKSVKADGYCNDFKPKVGGRADAPAAGVGGN